MDSIFSFGPLWSQDECITDSNSATEDIKSIALRICLERNRLVGEQPPCLEGTFARCIEKLLLWNEQKNNIIIDRIIALSAEEDIDPVLLVKEAIALWYISAVPISARDPHQGFKPDAEVEIEDGHTIIRWNRQYAAKQHELANLGLIAMLSTSETWSRPEHPSLQFGTLVANAVTTILLGTFMILPKMESIEPASVLASSLKNNEAMRLYLRTSWQLAQEGTPKYGSSPSAEFGANSSELKLDYNGRRLLSKIGHENWTVASLWHPCRKTPGSPWNKFIKNKKQPYFPKKAKKTSLQYQIPSSCLSLADTWETYYSELRTRFDNVRFSDPHPVS
uniref:MAT1-1-2 n=1 Tax=Zarea flavida TaxID=170723 RepID=Q1MVS3_9HYPO|nr:MAT1-1-2 [Lecanicillium flavidum]